MQTRFSCVKLRASRAGAALLLCGGMQLQTVPARAQPNTPTQQPETPPLEPGLPMPAPPTATDPAEPGAPPPAEPPSAPSAASSSAEPAPTTTTEPSADDAAALAALSSELASEGTAELGMDEPQFSLYGFADFTYFTQVGKNVAFAPQYSSFMVGNFNVYFSTEFEQHWRSLAEVRFMYLPHGSFSGDTEFVDTSSQTRTNTSVLDGTDLQRPVRWGGIAIQRVWLEYQFDNYLTLRAGQWLTPYGIWNVDHGSPTIINVYKPYVINQNLFPERQTGLEGYGSLFVGDTKIGYHLTLSNGRGPVDAYRDFDNNKGVGGRVYFQNDALLGTLTLGASAYRGTYSERGGNGLAVVNNVLVSYDPPTLKYDELALALDLKWELGGLYLQSEGLLGDISYRDGLRPPIDTAPAPPKPAVASDKRRIGIYGLLGYRIPGWNIMPFVLGQYYDDSIAPAKEMAFGVNVRPSPRVALKAEYKYIFIEQPPDGVVAGDLDFLGLQVAWSF